MLGFCLQTGPILTHIGIPCTVYIRNRFSLQPESLPAAGAGCIPQFAFHRLEPGWKSGFDVRESCWELRRIELDGSGVNSPRPQTHTFSPRSLTGGNRCRAFVCDVAIECRTNIFRPGVGFEWGTGFGFPPVDHRGLIGRGGHFIFHSREFASIRGSFFFTRVIA